MERLTEYRVPKGGLWRKYPCFSLDIVPDDKNCPMMFCEKARECDLVHVKSRKCPYLQIIDRLAAYEDTGLTPEEIMELCSMDKRARMAELLRTEENLPLTLEELREMEGEPVWVTSAIGERPKWYIVDVEENCLINIWDSIILDKWNESYPYKAYRCKPEEGTT